MSLDKNNVIDTIIQNRPKHGPRYTYIFKCCYLNCKTHIKVRSDALKTHSGKCSTHSHVKREFESIYNSFKWGWRGIKCSLTYEQFLEFTKIKNCHYCYSVINWIPYSVVNGRYKSRAYYLDRKNNNGAYSKENCVVCCTKCNIAKNSNYSYNDWYGMTEYYRLKVENSCVNGVCGL